MTCMRFSGWFAAAGLAFLLTGCVVAPLGPRYAGGYRAPVVYVDPAPVVVVPAPGYYYGYRGHRYWR